MMRELTWMRTAPDSLAPAGPPGDGEEKGRGERSARGKRRTASRPESSENGPLLVCVEPCELPPGPVPVGRLGHGPFQDRPRSSRRSVFARWKARSTRWARAAGGACQSGRAPERRRRIVPGAGAARATASWCRGSAVHPGRRVVAEGRALRFEVGPRRKLGERSRSSAATARSDGRAPAPPAPRRRVSGTAGAISSARRRSGARPRCGPRSGPRGAQRVCGSTLRGLRDAASASGARLGARPSPSASENVSNG